MNRYRITAWVPAPPGGDPRVTGTYYELLVDSDTADTASAAVRKKFPTVKIRTAQLDLVFTDRVTVLTYFPTED